MATNFVFPDIFLPYLGLATLEWLSVAWFLVCWIGYTRYSSIKLSEKKRLQNMLRTYINQWIEVLNTRDNRIVDTAIIGMIDRNATFFASSSLLIIAGLATALGSSDKIYAVLANMPWSAARSPYYSLVGLLMLMMAFIYAFFTFTWSIRQWGFAAILVGSVPNPLTDANNSTLAEQDPINTTKPHQNESLTQLIWLAVYHFNTGLRAYYFSLALLAWFIHPLVFIFTSTWVVAVLYRREFHSRTLQALLAGSHTNT